MDTKLNDALLAEDTSEDDVSLDVNTDIAPKDPSKSKKISLGSDYYSLTWSCLKTSLFENKTFRGKKIFLTPSDYFQLYFDFLIFIIMLGLTIILLVRNIVMDDIYKESIVPILICRCILMIFALQKIGPEINIGYAKYLYAYKHPNEFTYSGFAKFVGLCQAMNAIIAITGVLFFVCTADEFGKLLTNFSGICVVTELDNWIGNMILIYKLNDDELPEIDHKNDSPEEIEEKTSKILSVRHKRKSFDRKNLNDRLSVIHKMAMIEDEDLEIYVDDELNESFHWIILWIDKINHYLPWELIISILTVLLSYAMPHISEFLHRI